MSSVIYEENINIYKYDDPFYHIIFDNIFNKLNIDDINSYLPSVHMMDIARSEIGQQKPKRFNLWIDEKNLKRFNNYSKELFWKELTSLLSNYLTEYIISSKILDKNLLEEHVVYKSRIVKEILPYTLSAHIDQNWKYFTFVLYLLCKPNSIEYGTQLYGIENEKIVLQKRIPFLFNTALLIPVLENSWHGGEWENGEGERWTLQLFACNSKWAR